MNVIRLYTVTCLTILASACTVVPGGHIDDLSSQNESLDLTDKINTHYVTPAVIANLKKAEPEAKANLSLDAEIEAYDYIIGIGDVLNVTVWDHPELTIPAGQFRSAGEAGNVVHADGTIFYPYIGKTKVAGKSVTQVRDLIAKRLAKYIEAPQLDVTIAAFRSKRTFVTGEVKAPSVLPITNVPLTLLDALNTSGGLSPLADWRSVVLTRKNKEETLDLYALYQKGDMTQNRLLQHNDIIHVPRNDALKVFVMGDVKQAQTQVISRAGLTIAEALNNSGGFSEQTADASGIFVLRASKQEGKLIDVYQLDASNSSALVLGTQFELQPMDIVYVTSAPISRWNRVIQQLLPTAQLIYYSSNTYSEFDSL
ncbi:polysaccharide export protein [Thalassotalea agarivorans]|uniref:Polysaccharide export outer membrane protein n=1 Tax=Thalassotalea agarivorans TaxID=349064 RepID=A0A1H9Y2N7_THASX|nr:polysaccharide export protein [Thalassotalea agarivorans]SES62981.1 polysaccharide export outer membrane protein [Thalassotalea agarivorans]